jgi:phosphomannomutase
MTNKYIFDVDGTLTASRQQMDAEFQEWFTKFASDHEVYIVTGSDKQKTLEQIGQDTWDACTRVYQCSGNDVWENGENIRVNKLEPTDDMNKFFSVWLNLSNYTVRTGQHVDVRPGLINFSIVGRGATKSERADYVKYDEDTSERSMIAEAFNNYFRPAFVAQVAGETGIDIMRAREDKSQIIRDFQPSDTLHFFGDKVMLGGNDYTLAAEVIKRGGSVYSVKDWRETWQHLKRS